MNKTTCLLTRDGFKANGETLTIKVYRPNGDCLGTFAAPAREFATKSLGYYANGKLDIAIGGVDAKLQVGFNLTVVGSKELPAAAPQS